MGDGAVQTVLWSRDGGKGVGAQGCRERGTTETRWVTETDQQWESSRQKGSVAARVTRSNTSGTRESDLSVWAETLCL